MRSRFSDETLSNFNDLAYFIPAVIAQSTDVPVPLTDRLLRRYGGIIEPMYQFALDWELALWRQKWLSQLSDRPDAVIPQTAADGLAACDQQAFPLIHTFLTIFLTLPVSTASAERSFSTLRRLKTWMRSRMGEERLTGLAILNVHRDIAVHTYMHT